MKIGNTTATVHSNLVNMSKEERKEWFDRELAAGNHVLMQMAAVISRLSSTKEAARKSENEREEL